MSWYKTIHYLFIYLFLTLPQPKKGPRGLWADVVGLSNPTLTHAGNQYLVLMWRIFSCFPSLTWPQVFLSPVTFPERQWTWDLFFAHSLKCLFSSFHSLFPFFLDRAHRDLPEDQNARSVSKLRTQSAALHKIFCDTKCKQRLKEWGEENKSNNSENWKLSQCP